MLSTYNRVEPPKETLEDRLAALERIVKAQAETIDELLRLVGPPTPGGRMIVLDEAIIGHTINEPTQVIYDYGKLLHALTASFSELPEAERWDAAREWYDFNIERSLDHLGPGRPLIMVEADREDVDAYADDQEE